MAQGLEGPAISQEVVISSVLRIGHRGAAGHAPENTLAAIWKARAFRADLVEVDIRETCDGHLVLLHDETVDRTTNRTGHVAEMTLDQVQHLDAGHGQCIPTLEEAIKVAKDGIGMILELKVEGIGNKILAIADQVGLSGPLILASFLTDELHRVRQAAPSAQIMVLHHRRLPQDPIADVVAVNASHVGLHFSTVTPALLQTCHNLGQQVFTYTVNQPRDIRHMRDMGVDGIISDFPDRI